jgi:hypothetical protein
MASITGSQYDVFAGGQTINFGITSDPNNVPPPVGGDFNLEVVVNATGTGSSSGNPADTIHGGTGGNETIVGGTGDTITGGSGNEFINAYLGGESIVGGSGNELIYGAEAGQSGNTIQGAAAGGSATIAFSASHNAETLWDDGTASGSDTVYGYNTAGGDNFSMASGETISSSSTSGGNVVVTLSDGSTITFVGTTDVAGITGSFHNH